MPQPPLTLLLGGESLLGRRSGIGRMTLQIAQTLRHDPRIAATRLLFGSGSQDVSVINTLPGDSRPPSARFSRLTKVVQAIPPLVALRRAMRLRRLDAHLRHVLAPSGEAVVYHEPNMIARPFSGATVISVNDLSWHHHRDFHPAERIAWIERGLPLSLQQARRIVAISEFTKREIVQELGISPSIIDAVPLAPAAVFRPIAAESAATALARHDLNDRQYILSVSTLEPRKNFDGLLAAYLRLPERVRERNPLAIVGGAGWGKTLTDRDATRAVAAGQLRLLGYADDETLAMLYARAACFAFVSHYEGFGLPVVEAMASGTPVIASSTTAVGETAGDAAATVDPTNHTVIATAIARVLEDPGYAETLRVAGAARAAGYTWANTADRLIDCWRAALAG